MSTTPEQSLILWFLHHIPAHWHAQRIESSTAQGIPDLNLCLTDNTHISREIWIEFKADHKYPMLRPAQFAWLLRRSIAGGRCVVVHRDGEGNWSLHVAGRWVTTLNNGHIAITSSPVAHGSNSDFPILLHELISL